VPTCTVSGYTIEFLFEDGLTKDVESSCTIYSVKNPPFKGGTGNFILKTLNGNQIIDENEIFGVIGIADSISALTSTNVEINSEGSSYAGQASLYNFRFKTS